MWTRIPVFLLALASSSAAQTKLNPPLATDPVRGGHVHEYSFSPDGARVVQRVDERAGIFELYTAPSDGSAPPVRVHPALGPAADVSLAGALALGRVVFVGDLELDECHELWSAPDDGAGPLVRLSTPPVGGGDVQTFRLAAGGARAVYLADQDVDERFELYSVPLDGSAAPVRLNPPMGANNDVLGFQLSADGARVVYLADQDANLVDELYGVPVDGSGAPVKLNAPLASGVKVLDFVVGAALQTVLFRTGNSSAGAPELFAAPLDGSAPAQLLTVGLAAGRGADFGYTLDPSETHAVYWSRDVYSDLFSTPLASPAPVRLNPVVSQASASNFALSADGATVAFRFTRGFTEELRAVPLGGGPSVLLHSMTSSSWFVLAIVGANVACLRFDPNGDNELVTAPLDGSAPALRLGGGVANRSVESFQVAGSRLVYKESTNDHASFELFSVPDDGSAPAQRLNAPLASGSVTGYRVEPVSGRVAYLAAEQAPDRPDLYSRPSDASTPSVRLSPALFPGPMAGDVSAAAGTSDGRYCVYLATQDELQSIELFSVDLTHGYTVRKLNGPVDGGRDVSKFALLPDQTHVVFTGDLEPAFGQELYLASLDASQPPLRLAPPVGETISGFLSLRVTPDGVRVVYETYDGLHSLPLDGSGPDVRLNDTVGGRVFSDYVFTAERVVYRESIGGGPHSLHSAPLDGSAGAVVLQPPLHTGMSDFRVSPDGSCVVYRADADTQGVFELYVVPLDGSAPPLKLNPSLASGGDVSDAFVLDAASGRVAYQADQATNDIDEIFAVPLDGSAPAQKLSGTLVAGGDVELAGLTPSGRVLFMGDALTNEVRELFSVPIVGGAPPLRISGTPAPGADVIDPVSAFFLLASGGRVVYEATQTSGPPVNLYVTAEDGSSPPRRLNAPLPPGTRLNGALVDGPHVLFLSNQRDPAKLELWLADLDGLPRPRVVSGALVTGGNVVSMLAAAGRGFYLADQDTDEAVELYLLRDRAAPPHTAAGAPGTSVQRGVSYP